MKLTSRFEGSNSKFQSSVATLSFVSVLSGTSFGASCEMYETKAHQTTPIVYNISITKNHTG